MTKRILFSPIGATDPIKGGYDGAMLHICRHCQIDEVFLYLSQAMLTLEDEDHRYTRAIEHLEKIQNRTITYHLIKRPALTDPHLFNYFYEDFYLEIIRIKDLYEENESIELFLNVSSGTPAMKSALLCIATLKDLPCKIMQVADPAPNKQRMKHEKDITDEVLDNNLDDLPGEKVRVEEISCPDLAYYNEENSIIKLVKAYSYKAAFELAKTLPQRKNQNYLPYLELAVARESLDLKQAITLNRTLEADVFPFKQGDKIKVFEYALNAQLKLKRGELSDYLRSLTPLIADLLERILKEQGYDFTRYTTITSRNNKRVWDKKFIEAQAPTDSLAKAILKAATEDREGHKNFKEDISSLTLNTLIKDLLKDNTKLVGVAQRLRNIDSKMRNRAAHEITSIDENHFTKLLGMSSKATMELIKKSIAYTDLHLKFKDPAWDSYEKLNALIEAKINEPVAKD